MSAWLVAVAERGDREAFASLFRHFGPRIRAYLLRAGGDAGRVDDVLQETFTSVWNRAALYDRSRASAATWIFTIARNRMIDAFRHDSRPEFDPNDPALHPNPLPGGEEAFATQERAEAIKNALATLSEGQREVLWLSFYEGESYPEIAIRLGIPVGTVKSRARLAFGRLRSELGTKWKDMR
ncbi:MAG: sigma-70 family RNA polymerase sigma factor [Roseovarius sp.]|nr:sigma-70 family RNA polymerase sigma factor [Roseovarius sp.]MCY4208944.1 sigma-70 family RNA polymerase sigma factor [Roseovarius sp.]MCY4292974.1 sigma-70 family RNA polymerase sigma factor [Roseovarius sp.]